MIDDDGSWLARGQPSFESAWGRYLIAEQRALVARAEGILARSLGAVLPGESQEEFDRWAEEDRSLTRKGLVELMNEEGETCHKHVDDLEPWDVADRLRADTARTDWLASRTEQLVALQKALRLSGDGRMERTSPGLSHRQLEILKCVARGFPNRLIAKRFHLAEGTLKRHLANIYAEIGVSSRGEAVAKGIAEGWLALEDITPEDRASDRTHAGTDGTKNEGASKDS